MNGSDLERLRAARDVVGALKEHINAAIGHGAEAEEPLRVGTIEIDLGEVEDTLSETYYNLTWLEIVLGRIAGEYDEEGERTAL